MTGSSNNIERQFCMDEDIAPKLQWECDIDGCQSCNEIIFEHLDGLLGSVDTMVVGLHQLPNRNFGI